jgi:acyl-CoA-binding protein
MGINDDFTSATARSKEFTRRPSNEELLDLYALFKQATAGDNTDPRPGGFDFKAIAKHDAWSAKQGTPKEEAMKQYVALVDRLEKEYR